MLARRSERSLASCAVQSAPALTPTDETHSLFTGSAADTHASMSSKKRASSSTRPCVCDASKGQRKSASPLAVGSTPMKRRASTAACTSSVLAIASALPPSQCQRNTTGSVSPGAMVEGRKTRNERCAPELVIDVIAGGAASEGHAPA